MNFAFNILTRSYSCSLVLLVLVLVLGCGSITPDQGTAITDNDHSLPPARWLTVTDSVHQKNAWLAFRTRFNLENTNVHLHLRLAADTKYWLYLNGNLVVREGGLKQGPAPGRWYYDSLSLQQHLRSGENTLAILLWYFGKDGMSHKSSGQARLALEAHQGTQFLISSGDRLAWKAIVHPAYLPTSTDPQPNWRLPESNVVFDARHDISDWIEPEFDDSAWPTLTFLKDQSAVEWPTMVRRPIPFWKDFGLKDYLESPTFPFVSQGDTLALAMPYNSQVTPYLRVRAPAGQKITMLTDHYRGGGAYNMRAEYITAAGEQTYEAPGWINGEIMYYVIPAGVEVLDLKYRETGYATEFTGGFSCNDDFYNRLWNKALRTLYVTMRDTYMDCPDRERAQWWGDVVLESGEAFYALDRQSDALVRKGMLELMNWQRPDSTIFSPVPAGNWDKELPGQMLASVGYYGFWNYYLHTGDLETIREIYEPVKRYLGVWKLKPDGTVRIRQGGWFWGDWGQNKDDVLLTNTQFYLALKGMANMAEALGKSAEADSVRQRMEAFKLAFNTAYWRGNHYRSNQYQGPADDRSQALAVVSGLADSGKYEAIYQVLLTQKHASPYMEKYVLEALFQMGYPDYALERMRERFGKMVNHPTITTLWEGWGIGSEGYGGGTTNHAWSGGGLTLLSQYVAGISPTLPGYKTIRIAPQLGSLTAAQATVPSVRGNIKVDLFRESGQYQIKVEIPEGSKAELVFPAGYNQWQLNGSTVTTKESVLISAGKYTLVGKLKTL